MEDTTAVDARLLEPHLKWLVVVKNICDRGGVFLIRGGFTISEHVFTAGSKMDSETEGVALADLIRWGYCEWSDFVAGDLGCRITCRITEKGRQELEAR